MQQFSALAALLCLFSGSYAHRIVPDLEPESDVEFFHKDYPTDIRPPVYHNFRHPFPSVQDSDTFDKDYVKDNDDDNGEWAAQHEYDRLRNKLAKEKADLAAALAKENGEEGLFSQAQLDENNAIHASEEAQKKAAEARAKAKAAHEAHQLAAGKSVGADGVEGATAAVEQEIADLEDCKKKLEEARDHLIDVLAMQGKLEEGMLGAEHDAAVKKSEMVKKQKVAEEESRKAAVEEAKHDGTLKSVEEAKADLAKSESELEKAAARLRKIRRADDPVPEDKEKEGSTSPTPETKESTKKSGAASVVPSAVAAFVLMAFVI